MAENNVEKQTEKQAVNIKLEQETYEMLVELQELFYRAPTVTHTVRLLIQDAYKANAEQIAEARAVRLGA